ncbi:MAG: recombinase family protein [Candidatus Paceibacterota bacterium]
MFPTQSSKNLKYFLYARKSSENEDRQVQSIDDQISRLTQLSKELHLDVIEIFSEAKSAKKPNNRPIFDEMIKRIEAGEAGGILSWQLNRLSRNPIDSGKISWLLQTGILQSIQTIDRQYLPDDNVLLFNVESGMANQYIIELRKNVKRGIESKLAKGWAPNVAPLGYLNNKEDKTIITDPIRFPLIRKMWDMMLTGCYTPPQILTIVNKEWGFRTRKSKRQGDKELSRSGIYKIFTSIFYTGNIEYFGKHYQGNHEAMITLKEYDQVQIILGRKGKPRPQKHSFDFTGIIRCGECGCLFTAETKRKIIKSDSTIKEYTYYHCTRKTNKVICSQRKAIREDRLIQMISSELKKYDLIPQFYAWALDSIGDTEKESSEKSQKIKMTQEETQIKLHKELEELTRMRYRGLIDDSFYLKEKNEIEGKILRLNDILKNTSEVGGRDVETIKNAFIFMSNLMDSFNKKRLEPRKEFLLTIGNDIKIRDGILSVVPHPWFFPIRENYSRLQEEYLRLEPNKLPINCEQNEALVSIRSRWLGDRDSNPN